MLGAWLACVVATAGEPISPPPLVSSEPPKDGKQIPSAPPLVPGDPAKVPHPPSLEDRQEAAAVVQRLPDEAAPLEDSGHAVGKIGIGLAHRGMYEVPYWGLDLDLYLGKAFKNGGHYFDLLGFYGTSRGGIPTGLVRAGYSPEGRIQRFRIGGGPQTAVLFLKRATTGELITLLGLGIRGHVSFDVTDAAPEAKVLYVALSVGGTVYANGGLMYDVGLGFGLRI